MNLNQLIYVREINRLGSFSRAAQSLYISQSALSKSVHVLETELKKEIFIRTTEGVTTTEFGKAFLSEGEKALAHIDNIKGMVETPKRDRKHDKVRFRASSGQMFFAGDIFSRLLCRNAENELEFQFYQRSNSQVYTDIRDGRTNVGVISTLTSYTKEAGALFEENGLEYHSLGRLEIGVAIGRNNPVYQTEAVKLTKDMMENQIHIFVEEECYPFTREAKELQKVFGCSKTAYVSDNETAVSVCEQMAAFFCVAQSSSIYSKLHRPVSMLIYPCRNVNLKYEFGWIKKNETELTAPERSFVNELSTLFH